MKRRYGNNELKNQYSEITLKIKTHYDFLYENRPTNRANAFNKMTSVLPANLILEWVEGQNKIASEYTKDKGLKEVLSNATGSKKQ